MEDKRTEAIEVTLRMIDNRIADAKRSLGYSRDFLKNELEKANMNGDSILRYALEIKELKAYITRLREERERVEIIRDYK